MKGLLLTTAIILGLSAVSLQLQSDPRSHRRRGRVRWQERLQCCSEIHGPRQPLALSESGRRFLLATLDRLIPPDRNSTVRVL
jgi:hypothetical protein